MDVSSGLIFLNKKKKKKVGRDVMVQTADHTSQPGDQVDITGVSLGGGRTLG